MTALSYSLPLAAVAAVNAAVGNPTVALATGYLAVLFAAWGLGEVVGSALYRIWNRK